MSEYYLEANGIHKAFGGIQALKNVNLKIKKGESLCLVGENGCGKSTLIKIISGAYKADEGQIIIDGTAYEQTTPQISTQAGIQVIYQDLSLFPNMTVAENIAMTYNLSQERKGLFGIKKNMEIAKKALKQINVDIDLKETIDNLPIAQRQLVAIARALVQEAKLIIMDEPTTALTYKEVDHLYKVINGLKERGIALIFVSHKLDEIFRIAENIIVIRNGENIVEGPVSDFNIKSLTYHMTGKEPEAIPFQKEINKNDVILSCKEVSAKDGVFRNINFDLYKGEVLGITGLLGSGRESLAEALFGCYPYKAKEVALCGKKLKIKNPELAVKVGIGYIPDDRALKGLYVRAPILWNIISSILFNNAKAGFLLQRALNKAAQTESDNLRIKSAGLYAPVSSLSGGNQQRVVIAKWLALKPKLLILNCPTVGVDVGSKQEIHMMARSFAEQGIGVLLISDDLPEILTACNRVLVMNHGEITGCYNTNEISENKLYELLIQV